jgi:multidrug efflux pump subunit AcrA (membrane-fusion protein)
MTTMTMDARRSPGVAARGLAVVLAAALCAAMAGCKAKEVTPEVEVTVQAEKPETGPISEQIQGDAVLSPLAQAALSPKISAPVKKFYVQRGAHVHAGELLAQLEDMDLQGAALDTKGSYTAAEATYAQTTGAQVPEDEQKAQLDVAQAKANLDLNKSIVKGRTQLFAEGAIPGRDLDTAQAALVQAQAAYDAAEKHLQGFQKVGLASSKKVAEGTLQSAKGKYEGAVAMASYALLRSPINGVVTDRPLFAGETAAAGTPLITVMDTSSLLAKLHLAQAVAQRMKVGDKAKVTIPGLDDPVDAVVSLISPALDPGSTTVEVWVKLANPGGQIKPGTPAHVAVVGRTVPDALTVPTTALVTNKEGKLAVMVVGEDGAAHQKLVTVGIRLPETTQILTGIAPQDMVITGGGYGIEEGTKVKVGPADDDEKGAGDKGGADDKKDGGQ